MWVQCIIHWILLTVNFFEYRKGSDDKMSSLCVRSHECVQGKAALKSIY